MNTSHTPGPWTIYQGEKFHINGPHTSRVADVIPGKGAREDAYLIAAAPELLEALQTLVQMTGNAGQLERFLDTTARAVIAKATNPIP